MAKKREKWLVFVDTNILLDFYRLGGEAASRQLKALERHQDSLILTEQVRMEYLRNRQRVIVKSIQELVKPQIPAVPTLLTDYQPTKMLKKHIKNAVTKQSEIKKKIERILIDPLHNDTVYTALNRIFDNNSQFSLRRDSKKRFAIRKLACKRFVLGYPPRKNTDTSIGDAINWEWVVHCANESAENHNILIVSRDGDYGVPYGDAGILNDWLKREFKERVSQKRKIALTLKLTDALKKLDEKVTAEDETEERKVISEASKSYKSASAADITFEDIEKIVGELLKQQSPTQTSKS